MNIFIRLMVSILVSIVMRVKDVLNRIFSNYCNYLVWFFMARNNLGLLAGWEDCHFYLCLNLVFADLHCQSDDCLTNVSQLSRLHQNYIISHSNERRSIMCDSRF